ncbi:MAG: lysS, partial [Frankiales bacterium]|nr:lysS [Frankiales bacterium]
MTSDDSTPATLDPSSRPSAPDQTQRRREKLNERRASGVEPIAYQVEVDQHAADVLSRWSGLAAGERTSERVRLAGRLVLIRRHGGLTFGVLRDRSGAIQLLFDRSALGSQAYSAVGQLDRGDWVGVTGLVLRSDRGELSVAVEEFALAGKAIRPPPDKDKGLTDVEVRYRQRYVDLMTNESTRRIFEIRRRVIQTIRRHLEDRGFWEVEGPMLQNIQGGATARPFITHHNALDIDMYLRIALELHLKRLVVGGMERVFEIGRVFRNEGIDVRHNPEFTMLEAYQAFADYTDMMDLVEGMVLAAATAALDGDLVVRIGERSVDLSGPWPRISMADLIEQRLGVRMDPTMPIEQARAALDAQHVEWEAGWGAGKLMKQLVDERIQHEIIEPIFCIDYPQEVSPLARVHRSKPGYVERFELMVAGFELCNAYSEQNDSAAQLAAFELEARAKAQGDPEAGDIDLDYVRALEYGMPCTGGLGIGIDRLVMLLSGADNIREVILFPTMRPEPGTAGPPPAHRPARLGRLETPEIPETPEILETPEIPETAANPIVLGALPPAAERAGRPRRSRGTLRTLAGLAAVGGVIQLLTLLPVLHSRIQRFGDPIGPVWFRVTGHLLTMLVGLGLLFLAGQLARGKQRAWQVSTALFGLGLVTNILKGPHPLSAAYCAAMVAALLSYRRLFQGRSDPPSLFRLVRLAPVYLASVLAFGYVSLIVERDRLDGHLSLAGGLETIVKGLVGVGGPYGYQREFFREFFPKALLTLGVVGIAGTAFLLFRPLRARQPHTETDWAHARRLVRHYGADTLAYFALR